MLLIEINELITKQQNMLQANKLVELYFIFVLKKARNNSMRTMFALKMIHSEKADEIVQSLVLCCVSKLPILFGI